MPVSAIQFDHACQCTPSSRSHSQNSFPTRIRDAYIRAIQSFSQALFQKGWIISHYLVGSLCAEPVAALASGFRRTFGWKASWTKHGFYDAADPLDLKRLEVTLKAEVLAGKQLHGANYRPPLPLLLFHGVHSSPDMWLPWTPELKKAKEEKKIGHLISLQLPDEMKARQAIVRKAIADISQIYQRVLDLPGNVHPQVNLMGHSKGGYAAHLAAYNTETVYDDAGVERRWHCIDQRNPLVRKVISVAAPTWLCCMHQKDEMHPHNHDIYPLSGFTPQQLETIRTHHADIYDIIAEEDTISPTSSPLPTAQVKMVKHGHIGVANCPQVCRLAISILQ